MSKIVEEYRNFVKAYETLEDIRTKLQNELIKGSVKLATVYSKNNISFFSEHFTCDVYNHHNRENYIINKICNGDDMPEDDKEALALIRAIKEDKEAFSKYLDWVATWFKKPIKE